MRISGGIGPGGILRYREVVLSGGEMIIVAMALAALGAMAVSSVVGIVARLRRGKVRGRRRIGEE